MNIQKAAEKPVTSCSSTWPNYPSPFCYCQEWCTPSQLLGSLRPHQGRGMWTNTLIDAECNSGVSTKCYSLYSSQRRGNISPSVFQSAHQFPFSETTHMPPQTLSFCSVHGQLSDSISTLMCCLTS